MVIIENIKKGDYISQVTVNPITKVRTINILRIINITTETILDLISSEILTCVEKTIFTSKGKTKFLEYPGHELIKINKLSLHDTDRMSRINEIFYYNITLLLGNKIQKSNN